MPQPVDMPGQAGQLYYDNVQITMLFGMHRCHSAPGWHLQLRSPRCLSLHTAVASVWPWLFDSNSLPTRLSIQLDDPAPDMLK